MDDAKICPMLAIASAVDHDENLPPCLQDLCAWWLPECSSRMQFKMAGGCCAMSALALAVDK